MAGSAASLQRSVFLLCDVQARFQPLIHRFDEVTRVAATLSRAAQLLGRPLIVTEQYPKGLLRTVPEVSSTYQAPGGGLAPGVALFEKLRFSMLTAEVEAHLDTAAPGYEVAVLFGIEAHVCVQQTCEDLLARGKRVLLIVDGISSQAPADREVALAAMRDRGAEVTTSAALLFAMLRGADHPHFKAISRLVVNGKAKEGTQGPMGLR